MKNDRGVSLIEATVVMAVVAVLLAWGAPAFSDYTINARLREGGNALFAEALFAQSEAIKRNRTVRVAVGGSSLRVIDVDFEGADTTIRERPLPDGVRADTMANLDFGSAGRPSRFGASYTVDLSIGSVACSSEYRCPSLRVDAGGALRLCGDRNKCS